MGDAGVWASMHRMACVCGAGLALACCGSAPAPMVMVGRPEPQPPPPRCATGAARLCAGAAVADITPLPGLPIFGYSTDGKSAARGYRERLHARALVLEDTRGERLAIVQVDLGAVSGLVHRSVAAKVAALGLGPDRILLGATHTHGGPGGYFGERFYNAWGAGRKGFDEAVVDWLSSQIAAAITHAAMTLRPARLGVARVPVPGVTRNRSPKAWAQNGISSCDCAGIDVDPTLTLIRVDPAEADDGAAARPIAAFGVFAIHGNVIDYREALHHGDVQARAVRALAGRLRAAYGGGDEPVVALLNGAEGDVIGIWNGAADRSFARADELGRDIAAQAFAAFRSLDGAAARRSDVTLTRGYREVPMAGALTAGGRMCDGAIVGVPTIFGALETPSGLAKILGGAGAHVGEPRGCASYKVKALGKIQDWVLEPHHFPHVAPFQVFRLDPLLVLATIPGEPTTELGRAIARDLAGPTAGPPVVVVGLANEYIGYWTTAAEYGTQHYEGSSTFYGPLQASFAREQLAATAAAGGARLRGDRSFDPGARRSFWGDGACGADGWRFTTTPRGAGGAWKVAYVGPPASRKCNPPPRLAIECDGAPLLAADGLPEDDDSLHLTAELDGGNRWTATWTPSRPATGSCRFVLARPEGLTALRSEVLR